ncbi:uncharacterized protein LOC127840095 [Dreissena polymorpha]|uniref:uncharacterized protein LOC127840095 n=1 Tax=Dreissena polymorpha TaxID=45954 RepID=UPI00226456DA|nr:uncharacterized protein LOC127840095 [Dreissena polymorpha]
MTHIFTSFATTKKSIAPLTITFYVIGGVILLFVIVIGVIVFRIDSCLSDYQIQWMCIRIYPVYKHIQKHLRPSRMRTFIRLQNAFQTCHLLFKTCHLPVSRCLKLWKMILKMIHCTVLSFIERPGKSN